MGQKEPEDTQTGFSGAWENLEANESGGEHGRGTLLQGIVRNFSVK